MCNSEAACPIVCTGEFLPDMFSPDESRPERTALVSISPNVPTSDNKQEVPKESGHHRRPAWLSEFRYKRVTEEQECYSVTLTLYPRPHPCPHASLST